MLADSVHNLFLLNQAGAYRLASVKLGPACCRSAPHHPVTVQQISAMLIITMQYTADVPFA